MGCLKCTFLALNRKANIAQKFFLRVLTLFGNLLGERKDSLDDLKAVVMESPAFQFETFCKLYDLLDRKHLQPGTRDFESRSRRREARTPFKIPSFEIAVN